MLLLLLATFLFLLCVWVVVPPPNGAAIVATVLAIELSPYLLLLSVAVLVAAVNSRARLRTAAVTLAALSVIVYLLPLGAMLRRGMFPVLPGANTSDGAIVESSIPVSLGTEHTAIRAYLPATGMRNPIVFTIYGGAWEHGTPDKDAALNRALASDGYAVFALDYRHAPRFRFPVALNDVRSETASILNSAADYRADRSRVAILGHSSGGELAELSAFASQSHFRALVSYSGAIDLLKGYKVLPKPDPIDVRSVIFAFMGATPDEAAARYKSASPLYHVRPGVPATLLIYGDRDHVVDFSYAEVFRDALRADGNDVTLVGLPWTEHGFEEVSFGLHAPVALRAVKEFLRRTMAASN